MLSPDELERQKIWKVDVPRLSLSNDALMHALIALTASHIQRLDPSNTEAASTHTRYLALAIGEHNRDINNLCRSNSDAVFMTATFIRLIACCLLQVRSREPYLPPTEWLKMVRSALQVYNVVWQSSQGEEASVAFRWIQRFPDGLNPEILREPGDFQPRLTHLLQRTKAHLDLEPWSGRIEQTYASTLNFLDRILDSMIMQKEARTDDTCRRLICFTHFLDEQFIDLVEAQQPRALAILGHYFALLDKFRHVWFIGDAGNKELHELTHVLPEDWKHILLISLAEMNSYLT